MKIPNHMGSMPIASAIGKNTGTVINMIEITLRKQPITSHISANISITANRGSWADCVASASICGKPIKVSAEPQNKAPRTMEIGTAAWREKRCKYVMFVVEGGSTNKTQ